MQHAKEEKSVRKPALSRAFSGMSRSGWEMASSKMALARSVSPRLRSSSANLIHAPQLCGAHSRKRS